MKLSLFACIVLSALYPTIARAAEAPAPPRFDQTKLAAVPERMKEFIERQEIAGAVTAVATREGVVQLQAVGQSNIERNEPMKPDAIFWVASMTKPVAGTAIMMLQEEGKLSVDDPVAKYIPELGELKTPSGKRANLTIRHLLTHTSGMGEADKGEADGVKTLADLIPVFARKPLKFEPGSKWDYCQSGINTAGRIVEIASGQSLPDFMQKRLFEPLGMKDTTFYPTREQLGRLATSYKRTDDGKLEPVPTPMLKPDDPRATTITPPPTAGSSRRRRITRSSVG